MQMTKRLVTSVLFAAISLTVAISLRVPFDADGRLVAAGFFGVLSICAINSVLRRCLVAQHPPIPLLILTLIVGALVSLLRFVVQSHSLTYSRQEDKGATRWVLSAPRDHLSSVSVDWPFVQARCLAYDANPAHPARIPSDEFLIRISDFSYPQQVGIVCDKVNASQPLSILTDSSIPTRDLSRQTTDFLGVGISVWAFTVAWLYCGAWFVGRLREMRVRGRRVRRLWK